VIDTERTAMFNTFPGIIIFFCCALAAIRLISKGLTKSEIKIFIIVFLAIFCWLIGETIYLYYQYFMKISIPYPSIADIFYLLSNFFFSYYLYSSLAHLSRHKNISSIYYIVISIGVSILMIGLITTMIRNHLSGEYNVISFTVSIIYYLYDFIILVPAIVILITTKKEPLIFHWLILTLAITILVFADIGYTYSDMVGKEFIRETEWFWALIYSIGYIFILMSIIWYQKIKDILYLGKIDKITENMDNKFDKNNEFVEQYIKQNNINKLGENNKYFEIISSRIQHSKNNINILLPEESWIEKNEIKNILNLVFQKITENNLLKIRILNSYTLRDKWDSNISSKNKERILIRYFEPHISLKSAIFIIDDKFLLVFDTITYEDNIKKSYVLSYTDNELKVSIYLNLFEKVWLLETAIHGQNGFHKN